MSRSSTERAFPWYAGLILPVGGLLLIEMAMRISGIESNGLARPTDIAVSFAGILTDGGVLRRTGETLAPIAIGLGIGGVAGLVLGVLLGLSRAAARLAAFSIEIFRPIPPVALIPLALLVYGFGVRMEAAIIAFTCFWPMLLLTQSAVGSVDVRLLEVARVLKLGRLKTIRSIIWPAALPRIVTALRLTLGIALIVAVTTEIAVNPSGLGYAVISAGMSLQPELMYAYLVWVAVLGWALNAGLLLLQERAFGAMNIEASQ